MCQSTHNPAAASSVQALIDAARHLIDKMDRKGYFSEGQLSRYDALVADAQAAARSLNSDTTLYAVVMNDSGPATIEFDTEADRRAFLVQQDEMGDDVYTLDVGPFREIDLGLANIGEYADTTTIEPTLNRPSPRCWTDKENPAVSAIFLWQGLGRKAIDSMTDGLGGQIGIADWLMPYAAICERKWQSLGDDLPGVFHYDIVEEMGLWLGQQEAQPSYQAFATELEKRVGVWLKDEQAVTA
jgi:hypothetical protein